ncbi:NtaA/DmoA family FMN-dependent monooxygenase [Actinomadura madurae]|uniref:NtaA/DmoA family FMN-dependent monooxygenase n=1 Tax=Actinomadura madurae TaxID=1993 RepID=UPI002025D55A|nr:NtaA/DmoA family FMN-dependent monooxygenase [Actinomadura madurae]URN04699.1 NtaA/DmoA family FMN-dependent monooxygenase [Actinomadura madurae]
MDHREGRLSLVLFFNPVGRFTHSWRRVGSGVEDLLGLEMAAYSARRAEEARFDAIFISDKASFDDDPVNPDLCPYEPLTTLGALSAVTRNVGLIATVSTTFTEPYNTARMLAQLDFLSKGRVGWNVVTSYSGAQNFNAAMPAKAERYAQAQEFFDVTRLLWDAWEDDAVVLDREGGVWADQSRIHHPRFEGARFKVHDALTMPRSPQGRPVIVQAGQSEEGVAFAARNAEVVFAAQSDIEGAVSFYAKLKGRVAGVGRSPEAVTVLPGLIPVVGETRAEADEIAEMLADLITVDVGLADLSFQLVGADLSGLDLDEPVPVERLPTLEQAAASTMLNASRYRNMYRIITQERPTLRQLIRTRTKSASHQLLRGTASDIADQMQEWYDRRACDGFTITPPYMPEGLDRICDLLVPELQDRGIFRTEYEGTTLRDTLGLERPTPLRDVEPPPASAVPQAVGELAQQS